jgi:hypothetical protein
MSLVYVLFKDGQEVEEFDDLNEALEAVYHCYDDELAEVYSYNENDEEVERIY